MTNADPAALDVDVEAAMGRLQLAPPGAELACAREARALTVHDVAERLLLSTRQVRALECADVRAFHNAEFYRRARAKYESWLGLELGRPPEAPQPAPDLEPLRLTLAESGPRFATFATPPAASSPRTRLLLVAVVVLVVISAYALGLR